MFLNSKIKKNKFVKLAALATVASTLWSCNLLPIGGNSGPEVDLSRPVKVAFLAPANASDPNIADIGKSLINSGKLAVAELGAQADIELLIYPTNFEEGSAVSQAQKAKADGASLIIGPLSGFNSIAVAKAVEGIPVWSFSNNGEIVTESTYLLGTSFNVIADRVVSYVKSTGAGTLGVIASNDASGNVGLAATLEAAKDNRMRVVYTAQYPLSVEGIKAEAPGIAASLKSTGAEALMFTDTPSGGLGIMANALADQGYASTDSSFMGLSRWDTPPEFLQEAKLEGGYFAAPDLASVAAFDQRYAAAYGARPNPLGGLGYDGVAAAVALVRDAKKSHDNTPFSDSDIRSVSINGALGAFSFTNDHHADRALTVLQVQNGSAVIVSGAPKSK